MLQTYFVSALGCKVNQYEAQQIRETLDGLGLHPVADGFVPDVVVINTCAVTTRALRKSRHLVRHWARHGRTQVIVVGCGAAADGIGFARIDGVTALITHEDDLPGRLSKILDRGSLSSRGNGPSTFQRNPSRAAGGCLSDRHGGTATIAANSAKVGATPSSDSSTTTKAPTGTQVKWELLGTVRRFSDHQRAFLKVQDGCDARCTYCIIPSLRPRLVSKPIELAVREATDLVAAGHREIVLTGICLGAYGRSTAGRRRLEEGPSPLAKLIEALGSVPGLVRLRLSSLEPGDVTDELLDVLARSSVCVPHLHLPLQSGADEILRRMNRPYRATEYLATVERVRQVLEQPAITTDIIVGFPGETNEQFEQTLKIVKQVGFARVHAFPFSPRAGTPTDRWRDSLPSHGVVRERMHRLESVSYTHLTLPTIYSV